jgi:hypothetical protein
VLGFFQLLRTKQAGFCSLLYKKESITKFSDALLRSSGFGAEKLHLCRAFFLPHRQGKYKKNI